MPFSKDDIVISYVIYSVGLAVMLYFHTWAGLYCSVPLFVIGSKFRGTQDQKPPLELAAEHWPSWPVFAVIYYVPTSLYLLHDALSGTRFLISHIRHGDIGTMIIALLGPFIILNVYSDYKVYKKLDQSKGP